MSMTYFCPMMSVTGMAQSVFSNIKHCLAAVNACLTVLTEAAGPEILVHSCIFCSQGTVTATRLTLLLGWQAWYAA